MGAFGAPKTDIGDLRKFEGAARQVGALKLCTLEPCAIEARARERAP